MTVFVVQCPMRFDYDSDSLVPKYDLSSADKFGERVVILEPGSLREEDLPAARGRIRRALKGFKTGDHILAIGDPVAIAMVAVEAVFTREQVSLLKWDRRAQRYDPFIIANRIGDLTQPRE